MEAAAAGEPADGVAATGSVRPEAGAACAEGDTSTCAGEDDGCGVETAVCTGFSEGLISAEADACISAVGGAVFATDGRLSSDTSNVGISTGGGVG